MKYLNKEDKKTREMVNKYFGIKVRIKELKLLKKDDSELQDILNLELLKLPRLSGLTRPKNRCILSCKGRAILRRFKVSHTTLREEYPKGVFPGVQKKSF